MDEIIKCPNCNTKMEYAHTVQDGKTKEFFKYYKCKMCGNLQKVSFMKAIRTKIEVSNSKMDQLDWCERKYRILQIEKIYKPLPVEMTSGLITHVEINKFWTNYFLDIENYISDINNYYKNVIKRIELDRKIRREAIPTFKVCFSNFLNFQIRRIKNYVEKYEGEVSVIREVFYPTISEGRGKVNITDDIKFNFVIDALFESPDKSVLIDWKTDKDCTKGNFEKKTTQLNRYSIAIHSLKKKCDVVGVLFLKESIFYSKEKDIIYSLEDDVLKFVRRLQVCKFNKVPRNENWKCDICEFCPDICDGSF